MNKRIDFTQLGGLYFYQDTLEYMQSAYQISLDGMAKGIGDKYIVNGCKNTGGVVSSGLFVYNGEFIQLIGGNALAYILIEQLDLDEQFDDGAQKPVYTSRVAKFSAVSSANSFPYNELKKLPFENQGLYENVQNLYSLITSILNFEPAIILSGCSVSDIVGATEKISGGMVLFNNKIVSAPAYNGAFPCYLTEAGVYTTVQPSTGLYITFDPHTSQRYVDVLSRAITKVGKIEMYETLSDRFDNNGIGRWEMKGFRLMSEMQGRTPVGLWFDNVAITGVTDDVYKGPGAVGGKNTHKLAMNEQGSFTVAMKNDDIGGGGASVVSRIKFNGNELELGAGNNVGYGTTLKVNLTEAENAHTIVQPYRVVVYAKRITI